MRQVHTPAIHTHLLSSCLNLSGTHNLPCLRHNRYASRRHLPFPHLSSLLSSPLLFTSYDITVAKQLSGVRSPSALRVHAVDALKAMLAG